MPWIGLSLLYFLQSENLDPVRESSLGCIQGIVLCIKNLHFISGNWRKEICTVACGFSPIKVHYSDHPKRFTNRINEVYLTVVVVVVVVIVFSKKYRYSDILLKLPKLHSLCLQQCLSWNVPFVSPQSYLC